MVGGNRSCSSGGSALSPRPPTPHTLPAALRLHEPSVQVLVTNLLLAAASTLTGRLKYPRIYKR